MEKNTTDYRDKINRLGMTIAFLRKMRHMTQEQLAERAGISRTFLSLIEAPNTTRSFSLEVLYAIADALQVKAGDLLNYSDSPNPIFDQQ